MRNCLPKPGCAVRLSRQEDHNSHFCAAPKHSQCCPAGSPKSMSYSCMPDHQPPCFEPPAILGSMYERKVEIGKTSKARLSCLNLVSSAPLALSLAILGKCRSPTVSHLQSSAAISGTPWCLRGHKTSTFTHLIPSRFHPYLMKSNIWTKERTDGISPEGKAEELSSQLFVREQKAVAGLQVRLHTSWSAGHDTPLLSQLEKPGKC